MERSSLCSFSHCQERLDGKVVLITGGARGIGATTVKLFVEHGAKVVVADILDELGRSLCHEVRSEDLISYAHCDVSKQSVVENVVDYAVGKYGRLDVMFNCAGVLGKPDPRIGAVDRESLSNIFDVNVFGSFFGAKHAARVMVQNRKGSILFMASEVSVISGNAGHGYLASKHAIVGLAKNPCVELGEYGIRVNCVSPFGVPAMLFVEALGLSGESGKAKAEEAICALANLKGTTLTEKDEAGAALYLAGDESKYISGLNLVADDGYSTTNTSFGMELKAVLLS